MKRFIVLLLTCLISISSVAEIPGAIDDRARINGQSSGIGAGGTVFHTWGFMYRRHFANNFGFSGSLGGWFTREGGHVGNELGLLYTFAHHKFSLKSLPESSVRVYLAGYFANIYRRDLLGNSLETGIGAGPGLEFFFNRNFALHLELPWMTFFKLANNDFSLRDSHPHVGGGFIYYF